MTTEEARSLLEMEKHSPQGEEHTFPPPGKRLCLELFSREPRLEFLLDISRGTIRITKYTFQNRGFKSVVLARLDIDGNPHRNPDGEDIGRTHLHLYDELYGDKWAYPPPPIFTNPCDAFLTLDQFLDFCHVVTKPVISRGLF